jgi:hypothetical protein
MDFYNDARTRRDRYEAIRASLWNERQSFDSHWREISDFMQPRRQRFSTSDHNKGDKRNQNIIDSTARFAVRTLASGLHAGLTSPARPWFRLTTPDPSLAKFQPVKEWLHEVTTRMQMVFGQTNLYNVLPNVYGDLGLFGTGAMSMLEDTKDLFRCYTHAIGTYAIGLDHRGLATTFVRVYRLTVRQIVRQFAVREDKSIDWSKVSNVVKDLWDKGVYETTIDVCHIVCPNEERDDSNFLARYKAWSSCYYELGSDASQKKFLRESGYDEFPFFVPRWDITDGDTYGTDCPGMTALGDVKQLQVMQKRKGQAIAKMVDPPLVGPPALRSQKTSLLPGDVTYIDVREGMQGLKSIHDVNLRIDHLTADIGEVQWRIQRAFFEDLFLMMARSDGNRGSQPITAREVEERHEEKLLALGPTLERTNDELLDPMCDRAFFLMQRAGMIPPIPEALEGVDLKVEYISVMAQAQKLVSVVGVDRFLQSAMVLSEAFPSVLNKINPNEAVDLYADMFGTPPNLVRTNEEADKITEQQQAAAAQQAEAEQAKLMAGAMKDAGNTPVDGDNALSRLAQGAAAVH